MRNKSHLVKYFFAQLSFKVARKIEVYKVAWMQ